MYKISDKYVNFINNETIIKKFIVLEFSSSIYMEKGQIERHEGLK